VHLIFIIKGEYEMFEISIIISCVVALIILKFGLSISFKKIKKFNIRTSEELEKISNKFQNDEKICNDILTKLNNKNVKIKIDTEYSSCLYIIFNNTIIIGKFKQDYMKLQTIAHECIHSCQSKKTLWANFIITNIYLIYFALILILEFANYLPYANIHIIILIFLSIIQYIIKNTLEMDAMTRARFLAKEYIEENEILNKEEEEQLLNEYDNINSIGIPFVNYYAISMNLIKIMIFTFLVLV